MKPKKKKTPDVKTPITFRFITQGFEVRLSYERKAISGMNEKRKMEILSGLIRELSLRMKQKE